MQWKLIDEGESGRKTYAVILERGDEVIGSLSWFAEAQQLGASQFTAIGAFSGAELGYFDFGLGDYRKIPVPVQAEVLILAGDVTTQSGTPKVHAHVVLGLEDTSTRGGHLLKGYVEPTLEVMLTESPAHLKRAYDPVSGLALIEIPG